MAAVTPQEWDALPTNTTASTDDDLPENERSTRPGPILDANGATVVAQDVVNTALGQMSIIRHGRGIGWIFTGFTDDQDGTLTIATMRVADCVKA